MANGQVSTLSCFFPIVSSQDIMGKLKYSSRHLISEGTGLDGIPQVLAEGAVCILVGKVRAVESLVPIRQTLMSMKKKPLVYED